MKTFLEYVAEDILQKHGTDLSRVAIVFPNKRASLFMNTYLAQHAGRPMWSPAYITISDLFRQHSPLLVADSIKQVCDLHKSFIHQTGFEETLDHFYSWGQLLLSDFDDLDKNMADADKVFANLRDLHELDDTSYLTPNQKEILAKFFSNFSENNTVLKERFLRLWSHMADIYHDFNRRLIDQGLAYEGALYRQVANCSNLDYSFETYIFVGFNLLQEVEKRLFTNLKKERNTFFYWDFDHYYLKDNEAGHFIGQYLSDFPNELDNTRDDIYRNFSLPKDITFMSAPTENVQARYISTWLREKQRLKDGRRTAIVLCNENLLQTVVHCIPDEVDKLNITTGYPLAQSPVASLVQMLINLQTFGYDSRSKRFRPRLLNNLMRHPYMANVPEELIHPIVLKDNDNEPLIEWMCDILTSIARNTNDETPLFQEAVFQAYTLLNRLLTLVRSGDLLVSVTTFQRLLSQMIQSTSIPFHGEPAEGIQVMGVLETRNLDFDHVLLLSCNEGNLPRGINDTSFIPYNLRKAYGLTTIDHKVAIFSYYFHRLLQRASDVTILYSNATTDGGKGEMSRFMLQLMVEDAHHDIHYNTLQAGQSHTPFSPPTVDKTQQIMEVLLSRFHTQALLTPTAINRYMRCPLIFYYTYACGLRESNSQVDETIDNRIFGDIFHEASQRLYTRLMNKSRQILKSDIEQLLKRRVDIERAVDEAINKELFQNKQGEHLELNGLQLINREVIIHYITRLLEIDHDLAPFYIEGLEIDVKASITTPHITTMIGGRIDRLDRITKDNVEIIRVIDYKTGSSMPRSLVDVDAIFAQESLQNHSDYYLQAILYSTIVRAEHPSIPVSPALLYIQHSGGEGYDPTICFGRTPITDVADYRERFIELLREKVDEIYNPKIAFVPTNDRNRCRYCAYKQLCSIQ